MTIVKELNELAKKMTGVNPGARTDAQALDYIEQHYKGGDTPTPTPTPTSKFDYIIPEITIGNSEIIDESVISVLNEIQEHSIDENGEINPLIIGAYLYDDDEGVTNFSIMNSCYGVNALGVIKYDFLVQSPNKTFVEIYWMANKWYIKRIS